MKPESAADWDTARVRFKARVNPKATLDLDPTDRVSFVPMEAVGDDGSLVLDRTRYVAEVSQGYTYFENGDVSVAKITPCFENGKGAVMDGLVGGAGFGTTELIVLRPGEDVNPRFLYYVTQSDHFRRPGEAAMLGSGGQKRVPDLFVKDFETQWPKAWVQVAIASYLDAETARIDGLIEEKRRLLRLLNEQKRMVAESVIAPVPGGREAKLGYFVDLLPGYAFPSEGFSNEQGDVPLLRGVNVVPGAVRWEDVVYWPAVQASGLDRFRLAVGDVVFGMDRPWISSGTRAAMIDEGSAGALLLQRVCRIRGNETMSNHFVYYALSSDKFRQSIEFELSGISVPHISPEQITRFRVPLLSIEEQRARCEAADTELAAVDQLIDVTADMVSALKELRSATVTDAVLGRIDVRSHMKN